MSSFFFFVDAVVQGPGGVNSIPDGCDAETGFGRIFCGLHDCFPLKTVRVGMREGCVGVNGCGKEGYLAEFETVVVYPGLVGHGVLEQKPDHEHSGRCENRETDEDLDEGTAGLGLSIFHS